MVEDLTAPLAPVIENLTAPLAPVVEDLTGPLAPVIEDLTAPLAPALEDLTGPFTPVHQDLTSALPPTLPTHPSQIAPPGGLGCPAPLSAPARLSAQPSFAPLTNAPPGPRGLVARRRDSRAHSAPFPTLFAAAPPAGSPFPLGRLRGGLTVRLVPRVRALQRSAAPRPVGSQRR